MSAEPQHEKSVPRDDELPRFHIPERFRRTVQRYAVDLVTRGRHPDTYKAPALLIIEGAPGEGKTAMAKASLASIGIGEFHPMPSSEMGGQFEGDASGPLLRLLFALGRTDEGRNAGDVPGCILLDDFDQSIARHDTNRNQTSNTDMLNAALMSYADDPLRLSFKDEAMSGDRMELVEVAIKPVLVILTVNDSGALYPPLCRAGRALRFSWVPTADEKAAMIRGVFGGLSDRERLALVKRFRDRPIAFYEAILQELIHIRIEREWSKFKAHMLFDDRVSAVLNDWLKIVKCTTAFTDIVEVGARIDEVFQARNYLGGR